MKILISKILFLFSIYNFIYPIRLNFIPYSEYFFYLPVFIFFVIYYNIISKYILDKKIFKFYLLFILLIIISLLSTTIFQSYDFLGSFAFFKTLFAIIYAIILNVWAFFIYKEKYELKIFKVFSVFGLIVSLSCLFEFFIPSFRLFLSEIFQYTGKISAEGFRVRGFTSGGSSLSFALHTVVIYTIYYIENSMNKRNNIFYTIIIILIYISMLFIGRSGFFLATIFLFFYGFVKLFKLKNLFISSFFIVILIMLLNFLFYSLLDIQDQKMLLSYALEPINNYVMYGEFSSKSTTNIIDNMIYLPDLNHLIIGAGYWRYPIGNYYLSDIGYFKILMSSGIIGVIIFYSTYIIFFRKLFNKFGRNNRFLIISLIFSFLIFELKEEVFTQNYGFKMLILLITLSLTNIKYKYLNE